LVPGLAQVVVEVGGSVDTVDLPSRPICETTANGPVFPTKNAAKTQTAKTAMTTTPTIHMKAVYRRSRCESMGGVRVR
jgi:hypothetical protein